jgi:hypothetical protein
VSTTTTTTTAAGGGGRHRAWTPDGQTVERAELLLRRAGVRLDPDVSWDRVVAMLARVLARHDPFASEHGRLLVAALQPRNRKERKAGPRAPAEHAIRYLLGHGEPPWPRAVAAALERHTERQQARARQLVRLAPVAARDGPTAARMVAGHWREYGRPPSPTTLGRMVGWNAHDTWATVHLLVEEGWLGLYRGQLRPGPRARQPAPTGAGVAEGGRRVEDVSLPGGR